MYQHPLGPADVGLDVHIEATGVAPERLRALVEHALACSPISAAVRTLTPLALRIETGKQRHGRPV